MWTCRKCHESVDDSFGACWNCGTTHDGVEDPNFQGEVMQPALDTNVNPISCPRCNKALEYVGRKRFHEGTNWGVFGELGELFVKREHFDVYVCPRCGRVEFFVDGIGEEYRPH